MKTRLRLFLVVSSVLSLAGCDKSAPPPVTAVEQPAPAPVGEDGQLAEARDALQRQALEIETKTALMDKQLAEMQQALKDHENAELRGSLEGLKRQNDELRVQAEAARAKSDAIAQRIALTQPPPPSPVASQPVVLPDYSLFYDRLAPYGRWFEVNGYGYCWRPTITMAGWRPYVDGCWVWSSLGWAWQSNEPFGWAVYHYGRWVNLARYGWVWVPGSEWAPAWVAWRQSRDCVGWAPLPPEPGVCTGVYRDCDSRYNLGPASYTFISTNVFVSPTYIHVYAPVTQQTTIYQQSVNVTQIVPSRGNHHAFVHQGGPPRAQMEQACHHPVPQRQVQVLPAGQLPSQRPHGQQHRDAAGPVAMVELPRMAPGGPMRRPEIKEHIQRPTPMSGFEGVPQQALAQIRETIAREKETAAVQQPRVPYSPAQHHAMSGRSTHGSPQHSPAGSPAVVNGVPVTPNVVPHQEASRPAGPAEKPVEAVAAQPQPQPGRGPRPHEAPRHAVEAPGTGAPSAPNAPAQETVRPAVAVEPGTGMSREHRPHDRPGAGAPHRPGQRAEPRVGENSAPVVVPPASPPPAVSVIPAPVENSRPAEPANAPAPAVVANPPTAVPPPPSEPAVSPPNVMADKAAASAAAETERARMHAAREQGRAAEMQQHQEHQQREMRERGKAEERKAAEQAQVQAQAAATAQEQQQNMAAERQQAAAEQAAAEAEKTRRQAQAEAAAAQQQDMAAQQQRAAAASQQEALAAQQQRMAAEQAQAAANAEAEKTRQQAQAAAATAAQQQEMAAQQQRAAAEQAAAAQQQRMAAEQAAAAEAEKMRQQQAEAAAMQQRQAEEQARRAVEEQRRAQEMAQRQAEEQTRRAAEEQQMRAQQEAERRAQEMAQRQAEEQARRQQEMAQRQAEEQARRAQEAEMQRAQEQARRAAEEQQMRAQQEAAQRAQEMAQRQAEEQARRAQEMAQRQAEEQARRAQEMAQRQAEEAARRAQEEAQRAAAEAAARAAAEAARNQPQPAPGS